MHRKFSLSRMRSVSTGLIALFFLALNSTLPAVAVVQTSSQTQASEEVTAKLTEAKGMVLKSDHAFDETPSAAPPSPARKGDLLHDGMQIATGDKSYAQLKWPDVSARAWANSIYSLAPSHRLVYLQSGQMIFCLDKNRKDRREYVLWTNLLQARVHGTTVFVQSDGQKSQISVLEGCIDVVNKSDHSVVRLTPGVVYEVMSKTEPDKRDDSSLDLQSLTQQATVRTATASTGNATPSSRTVAALPSGAPVLPASATFNMTLGKAKTELLPITLGSPIPIFETEHSIVSLFAADVLGLLNAPLLNQLESQLESLPLISHALSKLPSTLSQVGALPADVQAVALSTVAKNAQILKVPVGMNYSIGSSVGSKIKLPPGAVSFFPPSAIIGSNGSSAVLNRTIGGALSGSQVSDATQSVIDGSTANATALVMQAAQSAAIAQARASAGGLIAVPTGFNTTNFGAAMSILPAGTTILPGGTAILPNGTTITGITGLTTGVTSTLGGVTSTLNSTVGNTLSTGTTLLNQVGGFHL